MLFTDLSITIGLAIGALVFKSTLVTLNLYPCAKLYQFVVTVEYHPDNVTPHEAGANDVVTGHPDVAIVKDLVVPREHPPEAEAVAV